MEPHHLRRLGQVRLALADGGGAAEALGQLLPIPLRRRPTDLSPAAPARDAWMQPDCSAVREAAADAAAAGDFRLAALLQDLAFTADPKPPLSVDDCAPSDATAAAAFFRANGFVAVKQLFDADTLVRIQAAWRRAQAPVRALWEEAKSLSSGAKGLYFEDDENVKRDPRFRNLPMGRLFFDLPVEEHFFAEALEPDGDPVMLEMVDPPKLMAVLKQIIGDDAMMVGMQPRTVPPEEEGGYTTWHYDSHAGVGWEKEQVGQGIAQRTVKAFIYINDVAEDQGCT